MARTSKSNGSNKAKNAKKSGSQSVEGTPVKNQAQASKGTPKSPKAKKQVKTEEPKQNKSTMVENTKIDSDATGFGYVTKSQATLAIDELKKYLERSQAEESKKAKNAKSDLFEDADDADQDHDEKKNLYVNLEFKKHQSQRAVLKPKLIQLSKPFLPKQRDLSVCLFLRDGMIKNENDLEKLESASIPNLRKVLTLNQLKKIYSYYEKREELVDEYDVFVTDDAILSSLPKILGKTFYHETAKSPIAIRPYVHKSSELSLEQLQQQIQKVLNSTAYLVPVGTKLSLRVGSLDTQFTTEDLLENISDVLKKFEEKDLITVGLATSNLPTLPLFYTDKIYSDEDILNEAEEANAPEEVEDDAYTKALLELGDEETVGEVLGKKFRESRKRRKLDGGQISNA